MNLIEQVITVGYDFDYNSVITGDEPTFRGYNLAVSYEGPGVDIDVDVGFTARQRSSQLSQAIFNLQGKGQRDEEGMEFFVDFRIGGPVGGAGL